MAADKEITIKVTTETDTSEVDGLETKLDDAQTSADELGNSINNIDGGNVSNVSSEFDEVGNSADKADNEVQEFQGSLDLLDASALMSISSELSSLGSKAEEMSQDMNTAAISVGQLATQTGIAEPQMISLINNISNATFPNDEAMMYVKSLDQIGVSANNLGQSATDLDKINDAFGLGAQTTNSLGQELSVLGVDMNNVSTAFNALAYANSNTVGGMENYYTFLRKYDSQFKELGFNVDQASVIIAAATQKYGGGRAALSGLNDALKNANGNTRALEEALGLQAGALDNASTLTGQYDGQLQQLAQEEADHKSWLDQLGAAWEDMSLSMSPVLEPLTNIMGVIGQAGSWAVGVNGLIQLAQTTKIAAAAQWLWNAAMSANPIVLVVIAIIALIAVLGYLYFNNEQVRQAIDSLGQTFVWIGQIIYSTIVAALQWLSNQFNSFTQQLGLNTNDWTQAIIGFIAFLPTLPLRVAAELANVIARALGFKGNFVQTLWSAATDAVTNFANAINGIPQAIQNCLQWAYNIVMNHPIVQALRWLGEQAANAFAVLGLGQSSPGKIVKAMRAELDWTQEAVERSTLPNATQSLGASMADSFNPNFETGNASVIGNGGGNLIINFHDTVVDDDKRMQKIVDAVTREINWDNTTAGRTI